MRVNCLNIQRGLYKKIDAIQEVAEKSDILGLCETDLPANDPVPDIEGFTSFTEGADKRRVVVYVRDHLRPRSIDLKVETPCVLVHLHDIAIATIYSGFTYDGDRVRENNRLDMLLRSLSALSGKLKKKAIIMGDLNVDWLKKSKAREQLKVWAEHNSFEQIVRKPTRIAIREGKCSKTLIDWILVREAAWSKKALVMDTCLSDHHLVGVKIGSDKHVKTEKRLIHEWRFTQELVEEARRTIPTCTVQEHGLEEANKQLTQWLTSLAEKATVARWINTGKPKRKSWYDEELRELKLQWKLAPGEAKAGLRNRFVSCLRSKKRKATQSEIESGRSVWRVVKSLHKRTDVSAIRCADGLSSDPSKMAAKLAETFERKVNNLKAQPRIKEVVTRMRKIKGPSPWSLGSCSEADTRAIIDALSPKLSSGPDKISYRILKTLKFEVAPLLTQIINGSIEERKFLDEWKVAKVVAIYKGKGERTDPAMYRPVALTSVIGRVVERWIQRMMQSTLERTLPEELHGFRPKRSTTTAIEELLRNIYRRKDAKKGAVVVALDASAAFDLAPRELILEAVKAAGGKEEVISWVKSYLSDRKQYVEVNGARSDVWESDVGVIQGGVLSPDFWNLLCMTLPEVNQETDSIIYADDEAEVLDLSSLESTQTVAENIAGWYKEMGLSLNVSKSEIMTIGGTHGGICLGENTLEPVDRIRFLGCTIQSSLSWNAHVDGLCRKIRVAASRIRLLGRHLKAGQKRVLYHAWIGGLVMCNARVYLPRLTQKNLSNLQTALNAGVRVCSGLPKRGHHSVTEARIKLGLPDIWQLKEEQVLRRAWSNRGEHLRVAERGPGTRASLAYNRTLHWGRDPALLEEIKGWNRLPTEVKLANNEKWVKARIKKLSRATECAH